jgi:hypothetical protein
LPKESCIAWLEELKLLPPSLLGAFVKVKEELWKLQIFHPFKNINLLENIL